MTTIYLLRHGEVERMVPRRFLGRTDLPLTEQGRCQIKRAAARLASEEIDRIVSSPLRRCRESAEILLKDRPLECQVVDDLAEIDLGDWEGLTVDEVKKRFPGQYKQRGENLATFRPPSGESFQDLIDRVWPVFERLSQQPSPLAVVAHAGVNRVLLCRLLGLPLSHMFRIAQSYAGLSIIHRTDNTFTLECCNLPP